ncbi:hypothetical protein SAMN04488029_2910 [Reichenbachiella faecimaris]|uniref:Uncharacterized protein n=1 Tax=Reichenbachiella faecimaris TaxID=692418 RepID=A0A1W2GJF3_REIFA|nr:hypothetical protein [Reichenbachiella faecimaris]SMD36468.1 hypothetical protein SAMN04488029_2910 [Reichenbachiella faecimaris]
MKLKNQNILLISPEPWDHPWVSKHHYAYSMSQAGAKIFFVNPPGKIWKISNTIYPNLKVLDYTKFTAGLRKFPRRISQYLIKKKLDKIEAFCKTQFDIIWSFDNSVFFDFTPLKQSINISHIVDLNQDFETEKATKTADICFYCSNPIGNRLKKFNLNSHFINHGFGTFIKLHTEKPLSSNKLKIGYAGNLNLKYLDWNTLLKTIRQLPEHQFLFAGPNHDPSKFQLPNMSHVGSLSKQELADFYQEMDLLILCYNSDRYEEQLSNPHKMMEYLGTGKPIVASFTSTYESFPFINMSNVQSEWPIKLQETINNLAYWSSNKMQKKRIEYAVSNSYENQIKRIEDLINQSLHG